MKILYAAVIILLLGACSDKENGMWTVDLDNKQNISVFDIFKKIEVVQLEANEESVFRYIDNIMCVDDCYFILDSRSFAIFVFNKEGKFKYKISNKGSGPDEYSYIASFTIDEKNSELLLLDGMRSEVNYYSLAGTFKRKIKLPDLTHAAYQTIGLLNSELLVFYSTTNKDGRIIYYSVPEQRILNQYMPEQHNFVFSSVSTLNNRYYARSFSNEVYKLGENGPELAFKWNFGIENNETLLNEKLNTWEEALDFHKRILNSEILDYVLSNQLSSNHLNYVKVLYKGAFLNLFYNRQEHKYQLCEKFREGVDIYPGFMTDKYMIGINDETGNSLVLTNKILDANEQRKLECLGDESNPILVKYYFKD